ncbi:hypothetical protein D3C72_1811150 [compost metagenome]
MVGVSSQREIEQAIAKAMADGTIAGNEHLPVSVTLELAGVKLQARFEGEIQLE